MKNSVPSVRTTAEKSTKVETQNSSSHSNGNTFVGCCLSSCQTKTYKSKIEYYADTGHWLLANGITHINNIPVIQNSSLNESNH